MVQVDLVYIKAVSERNPKNDQLSQNRSKIFAIIYDIVFIWKNLQLAVEAHQSFNKSSIIEAAIDEEETINPGNKEKPPISFYYPICINQKALDKIFLEKYLDRVFSCSLIIFGIAIFIFGIYAKTNMVQRTLGGLLISQVGAYLHPSNESYAKEIETRRATIIQNKDQLSQNLFAEVLE